MYSNILTQKKKEPVEKILKKTSEATKVSQYLINKIRLHSGRAILMERSDIVAARNKFLRELTTNRLSENPRPEIYLDETWVNQNTSVEKCWTNKDLTQKPAEVADSLFSTQEVLKVLFLVDSSCSSPSLEIKETIMTQ